MLSEIEPWLQDQKLHRRNLHLGKMDGVHLETVLSIASEVFPRPFFENQDLTGFFRLLQDLRMLLLTLHAAIQFGTGIVDKPTHRGRPSSPHVQQALELINAWENVTAERFAEDSPLWLIKRVPTPKREKTDDEEIVIKQPSTEFIQIALRMINPTIKDAQVFTAIKKALAWRDEFCEFARTTPPKSFIAKLEAFERFKAGDARRFGKSQLRRQFNEQHFSSLPRCLEAKCAHNAVDQTACPS